MESVAETSEEFMEKFFGGEEFTYAEIIQGLKAGVRDCSLIPVVCGSASTGLGTTALLNAIVDLLPAPNEAAPIMAEDEDGEPDGVHRLRRRRTPPPSCSRPWPTSMASISLVKVISGSLTPDMTLVNATHRPKRKAGPPVYHAGQEDRGDQGAHLRRHRRHRQDG